MKSTSAPTPASSQDRETRTKFTFLSETTQKQNIWNNDKDIAHLEKRIIPGRWKNKSDKANHGLP